jgi:hypothetical protein
LCFARAKASCIGKRYSDCSIDLQHVLRLKPENQEARKMLDAMLKTPVSKGPRHP